MAKRKALFSVTLFTLFLLLLGMGFRAQESQSSSSRTPATAADANNPREDVVNEVFKVDYADVDQVAKLLNSFCYVKGDAALRVIAVRGTKDQIRAVETALKTLDKPPAAGRDVEVTAYIVAASMKQGLKDGIPKEIESAVAQLGQLLSFKSFALVDSIMIRTRDGGYGEAEGTLQLDGAKAGDYQLTLGPVRIAPQPDLSSVLRLDGIKFRATAPITWEHADGSVKTSSTVIARAKIETDVSMKEGQKIIVGKTSLEGVADSLVLILTAKILE